METLKFRVSWINAIVSSLQLRFTETIANELRDVFPDFQFTEESFDNDIQMLKNMEVSNKILYSELEDSLSLMQKDSEGGDKVTPEIMEQNIYESVSAYNRMFNGSEKVKELNTLEYAIMGRAYEKRIEELHEMEKQNKSA
jgi:hypothetical protein